MSLVVYSKHYLTGTKFIGHPDAMGMQGHGIYMFPDGTRYMGHFQNGKFHGAGNVTLPSPYNMKFHVVYNHGILKRLTSVSFSDGLPLDFEYSRGRVSFDKWRYCTSTDRRFHKEINEQIYPVGPGSYKTANGAKPKELAPNIFDLGFGNLNVNGYLLNRPDHLGGNSPYYVGCRTVRKWIREHCRHGQLYRKHIRRAVMARYERKIMLANLASHKPHHCFLNKIPATEMQLQQLSLPSDSSESNLQEHGHIDFGGSTTTICTSDEENEWLTVKMSPLSRPCEDFIIKNAPSEDIQDSRALMPKQSKRNTQPSESCKMQ